ncbi:CHAD domain-containing protein [Magnetococcus sp. PR-3]|uniref:CHAD domain-containing protein n=1 Tax=Magnetococcus sp. PR-3 TaxID=3120355 RepID=UPI002FCE473F
MERPQITKRSPVEATHTVEQAFGTIIRHNFDYILAWEPLAHDGHDIEGVHQVRVGFRRMRSALTVFRRAIPREVTRELGNEMRWVAGSMGPARDVDVFLDEGLQQMHGLIPMPQGEERLTLHAKAYQEQAYDQVRETLDSERYRRFKSQLDAWLKEKTWRKMMKEPAKLERLDKPILKFAGKVLEKHMARVMGDGEEIDRLPSEELHQLRIDGKKLRYATEFFRPLFPEKRCEAFIGELKKVQDLLGIMNDVAVLPGLLEDVLKDIEDPEAHGYAGAALGWRAHEFETLRGQLPERWGHFLAAPLPWAESRKRTGRQD